MALLILFSSGLRKESLFMREAWKIESKAGACQLINFCFRIKKIAYSYFSLMSQNSPSFTK